MIEVKELRIGNYAKHFENGIVLTVGRTIAFKTPTNTIRVDVDDLQPITLTEEWLLKFGFIYTDDVDNLNRDYKLQEFEIQLHLDVNDFMCCNTIPNYVQIKYVHQLQNLYHALTGEELTLYN